MEGGSKVMKYKLRNGQIAHVENKIDEGFIGYLESDSKEDIILYWNKDGKATKPTHSQWDMMEKVRVRNKQFTYQKEDK